MDHMKMFYLFIIIIIIIVGIGSLSRHVGV